MRSCQKHVVLHKDACLLVAHNCHHQAAGGCGNDLRQAYRAVEQAKHCAHAAAALKGVGHKGEGHGQHGCPGKTDENEGHKEQIGIGAIGHQGKADGSDEQTQGIGCLGALELGKHESPAHAAHGLHGKEHTHPVAGVLIGAARGVEGVPHGVANGAASVGPHVEECRPAEELHQSHLENTFQAPWGSFT